MERILTAVYFPRSCFPLQAAGNVIASSSFSTGRLSAAIRAMKELIPYSQAA